MCEIVYVKLRYYCLIIKCGFCVFNAFSTIVTLNATFIAVNLVVNV